MKFFLSALWYNFKRGFKYAFQKFFRGWDDGDTWNLDLALAKLILPRLKRFKELNIGYPSDMSFEEWNETIDKMIYSFEFYKNGKQFDWSVDNKKEWAKVDEGMKLFGKHYGHLWW